MMIILKPKNIKKLFGNIIKIGTGKNLYRIIISPGIKIDGDKIHQCATLAKNNIP